VEIEGHFDRGDVIRILGPDRKVVACGRADYDDAEAKGRLGQRGHKPLVHYDYLYLLV
jgi:glutamate 5-kinase